MKCPKCTTALIFTMDEKLKPLFKCTNTACDYTQNLPGEVVGGEVGMEIPTEVTL